MKMNFIKITSLIPACFLILALFPSLLFAQGYTVINGSMVNDPAQGGLYGWNGTTYMGRENGPYAPPTSVAYQAINSPHDLNTSSGSALFTSGGISCSFTQQLGITAQGQFLTISADIAWDGDWNYLYFGFYEDTAWDRIVGASVDITTLVTPDTDGTLNNFQTVVVSGTLTSTGNQVRVFFGSACSPYSGGAIHPGTSKLAVDNVLNGPPPTPTPTPAPPSTDAKIWYMYD
jgi:hypothetical protein